MDEISQQVLRIEEWLVLFAMIEAVFVILAIVEFAWDMVKSSGQKVQQQSRLQESTANVAIAVGNALLERTIFGAVFVVALFVLQELQLFQLPDSPLIWGFAVLVADFSYYWMHRFEHEIRCFWGYHSVHHSSPNYDLTTSARLSWVEGLVEWIFFVPMIFLGFSATQIVFGVLIVVVYQTWLHTEKIGRLGILDRWFNTPAIHRVHHASNARYLDKNYGGILIIWDRLFGTYQQEQADEPVVYGITKPINSWNPITINFHEFVKMFRDCLSARSWREIWGYLFARPGWKPGVQDQSS